MPVEEQDRQLVSWTQPKACEHLKRPQDSAGMFSLEAKPVAVLSPRDYFSQVMMGVVRF